MHHGRPLRTTASAAMRAIGKQAVAGLVRATDSPVGRGNRGVLPVGSGACERRWPTALGGA